MSFSTVPGGEPGAPRDGGNRRHKGRDFGMPAGTPIVAPLGWRVMDMGEDRRSGKWVKVQYGDGSVHSFAHLNQHPSKREGRAGEPVAISGKDADDRSGHLHARTWVGGREIDPKQYYSRFKGR